MFLEKRYSWTWKPNILAVIISVFFMIMYFQIATDHWTNIISPSWLMMVFELFILYIISVLITYIFRKINKKLDKK